MAAGRTQSQRATQGAIHLLTSSAAETMAFGAALGPVLVPGDVILLAGDLGAGKTTLTKGLAKALGVTDVVTSPTFTLVRTYTCARDDPGAREDSGAPVRRRVARLVHADLFRLAHMKEVVDLAIGEISEEDAVAVVEWGDVAVPVLGRGSLTVTMDHTASPTQRLVTVEPPEGWTERLEHLEAALEPWRSPRE